MEEEIRRRGKVILQELLKIEEKRRCVSCRQYSPGVVRERLMSLRG